MTAATDPAHRRCHVCFGIGLPEGVGQFHAEEGSQPLWKLRPSTSLMFIFRAMS